MAGAARLRGAPPSNPGRRYQPPTRPTFCTA